MRQEVDKLVETAQQIALACFHKEQVLSEEEQNYYLEKRYYYWQQIIDCINTCQEVTDSYAGSAGSIVVTWSDDQA